ncbi:MAG: HD domain-containing phosphohydrolase [Anaerolineales bacterium]|jgi:PAS domain S-box-containing protein
MNQPIRVLYVDDNPLDRELVRDALEIEHGGFQVTEAASRADFESALANGEFDIVLSDFNILGFEGLQVLEAVHAKDLNLPVVLVTGTGSEQIAVEAMQGGAADYIIKKPKHIQRLPLTIHAVLEKKRQEDALRDSEERYHSLFEDSPVSLWEEDFSAVKRCVEDLRKQGIADFRAYFKSHPEQVMDCMKQIKVVDVNQATMKLFGAKSKTEIMNNLTLILGEYREGLQEELVNIAEGNFVFEWKGTNYTLSGDKRVVDMRWSAAPGHEDTLDKILLSMIDVTERKQAEEELKKSEGKFQAIFNNASDGMFVVDLKTQKFFMCNTMCAKMLGYTKNEFFNLDIADIHPGEDLLFINEQIGKFSRGEEGIRSDINFKRKDGSIFASDLSPALLTIDEKEYLLINFKDITERKQAEETLALRTKELALRNEELGRLYRASGSLLSSTPFELQSLATTIVDVVLKEFGQADCSLIIVQKDSNELVRLAAGGPYADQVKNKKLTLDGPGLVPQAIKTGVLIHSNDVQSIPGFIPNWDAAQSELTIPLKVGNTVIGVIDIQSSEPDAFKPDDERLMSTFAERAALALEHARLYAQTEQRMQNLSSLRTIDIAISSSMDINLTMGILVEQAIQTLGVHAADVLIFNATSQSFKFASGRGFHTQALQHTDLRLGDGYAGRAARERKVVIIQDLARNTGGLKRSAEFLQEGFYTYVGVPLIAKGQVKGVLEIFQREPLELNQEQRAFLEMLAGQAAIAIDSARLFEDLQSSNSELMMAYDETIEGWSRAMDLRDKETEGHTQRVTELTLRLANSMGFGAEELVHIRRGTLLHDIGKMGVPDDILRKPGPLTDEEWVIMRRHPQLAYDMLAPIFYLRPATDIPYCHHEKWDGTGYPRGLKGEQIPLAARIFAVVDVWDALSSDRPYRKAWPEDKVRPYIQEQAGKHFDPRIVEIFLKEVSSVE